MRALVLHSYSGSPESLRLEERPVPTPQHGEVLAKVAASPINPSDLLTLSGEFGGERALPKVAGCEGSGTVIATGGGLLAGRLMGRRVGFIVTDGAWAEYVAAPAAQCLTLPAQVSLEQGAMSCVNPMAAMAMVDIARKEKGRAVVNTAAASALGRMLLRLSLNNRLQVIHVVRRPEQAELLKSQGAIHVLDSSKADFPQALAALCRQLDARLAFDAIGGEMTGRLLAAMPRGAKVIVYGHLSLAPSYLDVAEFRFHGKSIEGFHLEERVSSEDLLFMLKILRTYQRLIATDLRSEIYAKVAFENVSEAISQYLSGMSRGKMLLTPR